ncbi:MAG: HAD family hydrolase [Pseudomonadota bacterium]
MNLALFDFDGTITYEDTFTPFIKKVISPRRRFYGTLSLLPFIVAYKLRWMSTSQIRQRVVKTALRGLPLSAITQAGKDYAANELPSMLRENALEQIQWHLSQGDTVVVVSASLDVYLKPWCAHIGVALICTELGVHHHQLTGHYAGGDCCGEEKAKRVRQKYNLEHFNKIYAYGDTSEDDELLALADEKYFQWQRL